MLKRLIHFCIGLVLLFSLSSGMDASASTGTATIITARCTYKASCNSTIINKARDGSRSSEWYSAAAKGSYIELTIPSGYKAGALYILWNSPPRPWKLIASSNGSFWTVLARAGQSGILNELVKFSKSYKYLRVVSETAGWKMQVGELQVWSQGKLPTSIQAWNPIPSKVDMMVLSAHPDDEVIYFGGTLPYYAGQLGKSAITVYMSGDTFGRRLEALNVQYTLGVRNYPVFLGFKNEYTSTLEDTARIWGMDRTIGAVVELLRRYKPDVVVTHDINGEYGHGHHRMTAYAVEKAVLYAGNPAKYPVSASQYGVWQVKKCYLHLYPTGRIKMNWRKPLSAFGGKTALDMARRGYDLYVSQHFRPRPINDYGEFDCSLFGLYYTSVGNDTHGGDFFENIDGPTPSPSPSPSPTDTPSASTPLPAETVLPNYPQPSIVVSADPSPSPEPISKADPATAAETTPLP